MVESEKGRRGVKECPGSQERGVKLESTMLLMPGLHETKY